MYLMIAWFVFTVLSIVPVLLIAAQLSSSIAFGLDPLRHLIALIGWLIIPTSLSYYIFWPDAFQRNFRVVELAPNGVDILVDISNSIYLEQLIKGNPMFAKLIDPQSIRQESTQE
jgi:hypothetical protein